MYVRTYKIAARTVVYDHKNGLLATFKRCVHAMPLSDANLAAWGREAIWLNSLYLH